MAFEGALGAKGRDRLLFGETHGCAFVTCSEDDVASLLAIAEGHGCPGKRVGVVGGDSLVITDEDGAVLDVPVSELRGAWTGGLVRAVGLTELPKRP